jgi:hypothetical protein
MLSHALKLDEATQVGTRAAKILEATTGHDTIQMARVIGEQAVILSHKSDWADAVGPGTEAYELHLKLQGPEARETGIAADDLGNYLYQLSRYDEARPYLLDALRIYEKEMGPSSAELVSPLEYLAEIDIWTDKQADAIPLLEREFPPRGPPRIAVQPSRRSRGARGGPVRDGPGPRARAQARRGRARDDGRPQGQRRGRASAHLAERALTHLPHR